MSTVLDLLHRDHVGIAALLDILAAETERMRRPDGDADYQLMLEVADYFIHFPDALHHPCEDRVYELLATRASDLAPELATLRGEHEQIGVLGHRAHDLLKAATAGQMVSREAILDACDEFLTVQRRHLDLEEAHLFPAAGRRLSEDELRAAAASCGRDVDDPDRLAPDARYTRIRAALLERAATAN
ncbi:MAG: hemerythrin domain-containing protein [Gammaproteobacteria bacterium]|nr:hemerythrin domain-containing protein [Gammaproteobacteria bacterium]